MSDPYGRSYCDLRGDVEDTGACECNYLQRWVGCQGLDEYCCLAKSTQAKLKNMIWSEYKREIKEFIKSDKWQCPMDDILAYREENER